MQLNSISRRWWIIGVFVGVLAIVITITLNLHQQYTLKRIPVFSLLHSSSPVTPLDADMPIIWVTETYGDTTPQAPPVYWQPDQRVFLQWKGKNYRLKGMSPAFAFRRHEVITLEGRELVVASATGTARRISLKPDIPNYAFVLNMQPTPDGVMLNVFAPPNDHHVVRVNLHSGRVGRVPQAFRVRCAETTDQYVVNWSKERTHQVRDGNDRLVRQHGRYPWHFGEWDADPVDDLFAITRGYDVTMIGPDSVTMSTIDAGIPVASVTMQPGRRQIWIAEAIIRESDLFTSELPTCRLIIYAYNGRRLGERTILGTKVLRAMPVEDAVARLLLRKYSSRPAHHPST